MSTELLVGLISAAVAVVSAAVAVWGQTKTARLESELEALRLAEQRRHDAERTVARYREPLARAAYDLQSRLFNILQQNLLEAHYEEGDERERSYVVDNTVFLIAQYFAWTEIVRRDIQYIDLGVDEQTRELARLQDKVYSLFQTDKLDRTFRVFAGEQRAIGERMIKEGPRGLECLGYGAYLDLLATSHDRLLEALRADVGAASARPGPARPRLVAIQHAMIDLLAFLDADYVRFPRERRTKAPASADPSSKRSRHALTRLGDTV
jgi:hypothetical protein